MHYLLLGAATGSKTVDVMEVNLFTGLTALIVFVVVLVVLSWKVWPQISQGLDDRNNKIRDEIAAAEAARAEASAAMEAYQAELSNAREEASRMIQTARAEAKAAADALRDRNETELGEMKQRATQEIAQAKESAISELHAEAAALATAVASRILKREVTADDQQRLVEESLRELSKIRSN